MLERFSGNIPRRRLSLYKIFQGSCLQVAFQVLLPKKGINYVRLLLFSELLSKFSRKASAGHVM